MIRFEVYQLICIGDHIEVEIGSGHCKGFGGFGGVLRYPYVVEGEDDIIGADDDLSSYFDEPLNEPATSSRDTKEKVDSTSKRDVAGSSRDSAEEETAVW